MPSLRELSCLAAGFLVASCLWYTQQQFTATPLSKHRVGSAKLEVAKKGLSATKQVSTSSQTLPDEKSMCHAEGGLSIRQATPDGSRCVFIDSRSAGHVVEHFHTFTPFSAMSCTWEVWHVGRTRAPKKGTHPALQLLKGVPGLTARYLPKANLKPNLPNTSGQPWQEHGIAPEVDLSKHVWNPTELESEETDLAMAMLANLQEQDYITVALHPDRPFLDPTLALIKRMGQFGVATWVDRWLVSTGKSLHYTLPRELLSVLQAEVQDVQSFPPFRNTQDFRASHEVTYLLYRPTSRYLQPGARLAPERPGKMHKQVFIDYGMNKCDTIYTFMTMVPDPQNWEVWGFEAVPSIIRQAELTCKWIEDHYPLALSPREVNDSHGLRRIGIVHAAAWIENTELNFNTGRPLSGSIFKKDGNGLAVEMTPAVDVADWIRTRYRSDDYIFVKMDIEGAEYPVLKHMMIDGVACWIGKWALEFHSLAQFPNVPLPREECRQVSRAFAKLTSTQGIAAGVLDRRLASQDEGE